MSTTEQTFTADATSNRAGTKWTVRLRDGDGAIVHEVGASSRPKYLVLKVQDGEPRVHSATPASAKPRTRSALAVPVTDRNDRPSTTKPDSAAARKPRRTPKPKVEPAPEPATPETAAEPTETTNEQDPREAAYLFVFDSFAVDAAEVAETSDIPGPPMTTAQARKLLKSLAPLVVSERVREGGRDRTVYQAADTYDHQTREQAIATIREFIAKQEEPVMPVATKKSAKPAAKKSPAKKATKPGVAASQYSEAQFKLGIAAREAGGSWVAVAEAAGVKSDHHFSVALRAFNGGIDPKPAKAAKPASTPKPAAKKASPAKAAKAVEKVVNAPAAKAKKPARRIVRKAAK